ncbi:MAG: ABC transporter permease [Inhella sp.]|jgi:ABC-2 type transport system permease protein|uniref:ABC transporter permease n=1 Tax=Inhella sp. TaxID=1921806 RepID=UPI0022C2A832|nr:ABC transporter permease [Inhella sp.]MCZ8233999.1 ABC transporter permease [Inhella sp.]
MSPAFFALVRKDLRLFLQDRRALLLNLLAPVLIAAFFGSLFGGSGSAGKPSRIPVAVTDLDGSPGSTQVLEALRANASLDVQILPADSAADWVRKGKLRAAVTLPSGFGAQAGRALFGAGPRPEIVVTHDPSQAVVLPMVEGLLSQAVMQVVGRDAMSPSGATFRALRQEAETAEGLPPQQRQDLAEMFRSIEKVQSQAPAASAAGTGVGGLSQPFVLRKVEATAGTGPAQGYNAYAHSFGGMGVQFILMLGVEIGVGLLLLRRQDLWKRLRAAPLSRATLLGSRMASAALIALGLFAAILGVGMAVFGVRVHGSWLGLAAVLVAFSAMTASFGLMVAALGRTPEATRSLAIVATLLMVMLGGAWVPSFVFPEWLQTVSLFVPTRWAVDGIDAMTWRGLGLDAALWPSAVQLGFALLFAAVAVWRFRWRE